MQERGVFITFEGGEGSGKSTQIKILEELFLELGIDLLTGAEPQKGGEIRRLLVAGKGNFSPEREAEMMFEDREDHLKNKILPAIEAGKWYITDRFGDSTRAYQGYGLGVDHDCIERLYKKHVGDIIPDLTIVFDIDPKVGLERSFKENKSAGTVDEEKYEKLGLEFHQRINAGFLDIARRFPDRCIVVDASSTKEEIHEKIVTILEQRFDVDLKKNLNEYLEVA